MAHLTLFGATGAIGSRVLTEALRRKHAVTAVVRGPARPDRDHPLLTVVAGDVLDLDDVTRHAKGRDVVVSAVGGGDGAGHRALIEPAARTLVTAARALSPAGPRIIVVNGAGSLRVAGGGRVWDAPGVPAHLLPIMHAHGDALAYLRTVDDVAWTALSPAASIAPGTRTGAYRASLENLVVDDDGVSAISTEDFAVALLDEVQWPQHVGRRFTVGR